MIDSSVPATGDGISVSTLSVETSSSGSSTSTVSPTSLSHRVTVPSVTLSPSSGIVTGVPEPPDLPEPPDVPEPSDLLDVPASCAVSDPASSAGSAAWFGYCGAPSDPPAGSASASSSAGSAACCSAWPSDPPDPPSPSPITARSPPTSTVSSSPATIRSSTPAAGEGISVSTLSVETSSSGSSTSTRSPSCLSQRVTVPSVTLSPRAGIWTVKAMAGRCSCSRAGDDAGSGVRLDCAGEAGQLCEWRGLPARARWASPNASFWVGCAWIRAATSSASASQL